MVLNIYCVKFKSVFYRESLKSYVSRQQSIAEWFKSEIPV
jgi:hypothetical protein